MQTASDFSSPAIARLDRLKAFLDDDPDNLNLLADLADTALPLQEIDTAREAVLRALEIHPGDPYFRLRLSSVAIAERNFEDALAIVDSLGSDGHADPAIAFNRAFALVSLARYEEAKPVLSELRGLENQTPPMVLPMLIRCCHYLGQMDEGIALGLAHMASYPDDAKIAGMLALLYFDADDLPKAGEWSLYAMERGDQTIDTLLAAGGAALGAEDPELARGLMQKAIEVQPRSGRAWANLALSDLLDGNLEQGADNFRHAVQYMPEHIGSWIALGWVQTMLGETDAAEASFQQALAKDDTFAESHSGLAAVAAMRGDWEQADAHAKVARRLDPESLSANYPELIRLCRSGDAERAQRLIQASLRRGAAPGGGSLLDMLNRMGERRKK